jgi:hypothetical protein
MQYLNEDGATTFQIKNSSGVVQSFEIDGVDYDCFKITSIPAGCGTSDLTTAPVTCGDTVGVEGDMLVWDYSLQQYVRLAAGASGEVITSNGAGTQPTYQAGGGGTVTAAANGTGLSGTTVELGINDLNRATPIWQAAFRLLMGGTPEAGKQFEYDSGPDLFKLNAHHGLPAINGVGFRYMLTFDGVPVTGYPLGKPTSWFFVKASNDTPVGGDYLASIGYFNAITFKEAFWEATEDGVRGVIVTAGGDETIGRASDAGGYEFIGKDNTAANHTITALDSLLANLFSVRNDGLIELKGSTIDPTPGAANSVLTDDGTGAWSMQPSGGGVADITVLDTITNRIASADGTNNWIAHKITTVPANTLAIGDVLECEMMMYRNASAGDTSMFVYISDQAALGTPTGATPWAAGAERWAMLSVMGAAIFATAAKLSITLIDSAGMFNCNPVTNSFSPFGSGSSPLPGTSGVNYNNMPFDFTQPLYIYWLTYMSAPSVARTRGYDGGIIKLIRA